jgi:hypothetical protein
MGGAWSIGDPARQHDVGKRTGGCQTRGRLLEPLDEVDLLARLLLARDIDSTKARLTGGTKGVSEEQRRVGQ